MCAIFVSHHFNLNIPKRMDESSLSRGKIKRYDDILRCLTTCGPKLVKRVVIKISTANFPQLICSNELNVKVSVYFHFSLFLRVSVLRFGFFDHHETISKRQHKLPTFQLFEQIATMGLGFPFELMLCCFGFCC